MALSNTTLGVLMATLDASIMLIAMPDIFRGIRLDPLQPGNSFYLLWMILSFLIVSSVLVVSLGRLGDIFGRVRMYNLGFAIYTLASLILTVDWLTGRAGALYLVVFRVMQGVGAAFLVANAAAILTDAFPENQRGLALGINNVAAISGSFIGLVVGGLLAPIDWRLIFLVSVPFGAFGTVWAYLKLEDRGVRRRAPVDWLGNITFGVGLTLVMIGITYGIEPYGRDTMGWTNPAVSPSSPPASGLLAGVHVHRDQGDKPHVPPAAVQDPRLYRRHAVELPLRPRAGRPHVHADHLAAGDLAPRARLLVLEHAALGGHLHAAPDGRLPPRRVRSRAYCRTASARVRSRRAACSWPRSPSCSWSGCRSTSPTRTSPSSCS